jgi:hypothetical protein
VADLETLQCTILSGQTVSRPIGTGFKVIVGFVIPAGYASGALKFNISPDGAAFLPYVDIANAAITVTGPTVAGPGLFVNVDSDLFAGVNLLQLVCATAPAANTTIGVVVRSVSF